MPPSSGSGVDLAEAYRAALQRIEWKRREAVERASKAMASTAGWQAAAKAAAAQAVLEATMSECGVVIGELVDAHVRSGDRDGAAVVRRLRDGLLAKLEAPGGHFLSGAGPEAASLAPALEHHRAEFEARITDLERLAAERAKEAPRGARGHGASVPQNRIHANPVLFWFLVVTAVLSLLGISWLDLARRAISR